MVLFSFLKHLFLLNGSLSTMTPGKSSIPSHFLYLTFIWLACDSTCISICDAHPLFKTSEPDKNPELSSKVSSINSEAQPADEPSFFGFCGNDLKEELERVSREKEGFLGSDRGRGKREAVFKGALQYSQFYQNLLMAPRLTEKFNKTNISWGVLDKSQHLDKTYINGLVEEAFKIWASVTPLTFYRLDSDPDIIIRFGTGLHGDCPVPFDDLGSQLGHSWTVGEVHINDALSKLHPNILPHVIVHELGHALGLPHDEADPSAIMYSVYYTPSRGSPAKPQIPDKIKLSKSDIEAIQTLYGMCSLKATSVANLRRDSSYDKSFIATKNGIEGVDSFGEKAETSKVTNFETLLEFSETVPQIDHLLQLGKNDAYASYAIATDLTVFEVSFDSSAEEMIVVGNPMFISEVWPCFGDMSPDSNNISIRTAYYNRRDRTIYFYSDKTADFKIFRFNTKTRNCLTPITFFSLHFDITFPKFDSDLESTPTEQPSSDYEDVIDEKTTTSNDFVSVLPTYKDWLTTTSRMSFAQYIKESDVRLVFQEHQSQETYVLTNQEFWRVRKSDYSLEYGGKIYEVWPYLCTF